ncbi:hypothetical protein K1T71_001701 [Dendrolimus kikuchii]|uniref:Uncharacterized protein n=1 Tax=Dendrolimus kikuchii TaxID=765133 RepID=A0ACC1DFX9_9NEOP|nr:hypothetical protein K1T71_001701 [Dendrolimus kikuchii]
MLHSDVLTLMYSRAQFTLKLRRESARCPYRLYVPNVPDVYGPPSDNRVCTLTPNRHSRFSLYVCETSEKNILNIKTNTVIMENIKNVNRLVFS